MFLYGFDKEIEEELKRFKNIKYSRYCDDILIQLSAVDKAIKSLANTILDEHIHTCLVRDIKQDKYEILDEITNLFRRFQ